MEDKSKRNIHDSNIDPEARIELEKALLKQKEKLKDEILAFKEQESKIDEEMSVKIGEDLEEKIIADLEYIDEVRDGDTINDPLEFLEERTDIENFRDSDGEIDFEGIEFEMERVHNLLEALGRLEFFLNSSDENFRKFTDIYNGYIASKTVELEVAPDELKEIIFGKQKSIKVKTGISKKFEVSNLFEKMIPQFFSTTGSGNANSITSNWVLAGISLSVLFVTFILLQESPPVLYRGEPSSIISIERVSDKIVINNKDDNNIELIMMDLDDKILNQSILKDSVNVIKPINGIKSYKIKVLSVETQAILLDTVISFD